jgi:hypothetical protein
MARGITESDVHAAADALVALGERPTVERIRAHLGTGSPNTVVRWLETWWLGLGERLASNRQLCINTANVPEAVAALAGHWWTLALDHARDHADETVSGERAALLDARDTLERDRRAMQTELDRLRGEIELIPRGFNQCVSNHLNPMAIETGGAVRVAQHLHLDSGTARHALPMVVRQIKLNALYQGLVARHHPIFSQT